MALSSDTTIQEYVEIIHDLQKKYKVARVKDIAEQRGVSRSSVSIVLNMLKKRNLVIHEQYGLVELTKTGERLGQLLSQRHKTIFNFLTKVLGVPSQVAETDACKLEHHISSETMECLINFLAYIKDHSNSELTWLTKFHDFNYNQCNT